MLTPIFEILGGLALFLYGLHTLSTNLKKCTGSRLKKWLKKMTNRPYKGALLGGGLTSIIQSSSITMVTVLGLINAGLLTLHQAIGVMLGAEIGTTVTVQLVAFNIGIYYLPLVTAGFILFFFSQKDTLKYIGKTLLGFGLLFLGMHTMKHGVAPLEDIPALYNLLRSFGQNPFLGILGGAIFTGIIQSSSATMGLAVAMGMENIITLPAAIALMFGANIGTCATALIASIKSSLSAKRAAIAQLTVNILGVGIFLIILGQFSKIVTMTSGVLPRQIANAHAIFNISVTLAMLPLVGILESFVKKIVPGKIIKVEQGLKYLDQKVLNMPTLALSQAVKETSRMGEISLSMLQLAYKAWNNNSNKKYIQTIFKKENTVDQIEKDINSFVTQIHTNQLSSSQSDELALIEHSIVDIERVADHANNIAEFVKEKRENEIKFSQQADKELKEMFKKANLSYKKAVQSLESQDDKAARQVLQIEKEVNSLEEKYIQKHKKRLKKEICNPQADPIYLSMLSNLERISDHSENIAQGTIMGF